MFVLQQAGDTAQRLLVAELIAIRLFRVRQNDRCAEQAVADTITLSGPSHPIIDDVGIHGSTLADLPYLDPVSIPKRLEGGFHRVDVAAHDFRHRFLGNNDGIVFAHPRDQQVHQHRRVRAVAHESSPSFMRRSFGLNPSPWAFLVRQMALLQTRAVCPRLRVLIGWSAVVMNDFKGRHFSGAVILWAVRWYCRYGISYRDLETMLAERGVDVDHSTIYRWVQRYAPEMEKRLRWYWKRPTIWRSWRVDETYIKVKGCWAYLYRAVDKDGDTIDFYLSSTRNAKAAKRFLGKALNGLKNWQKPLTINTDKAPTYSIAISALKKEGKLPDETLHRQVKYLNNVIEADHGKLKQLIRPVRGFKSLKTAYATIKGFEVMRALKKGQAQLWQYDGGIMGEVRLIERQFGIYSS